jgi:hypothetical protein
MTEFLAALCMLMVLGWGGVQLAKALDSTGEIRKALHEGFVAWIKRKIG